jgi:hypothetical protein
VRDDPASLFFEHLAGQCQAGYAVGSLEQADTKVFFHLPDSRGQGWLRHVQTFCCSPKALCLGHGKKLLELAQAEHGDTFTISSTPENSIRPIAAAPPSWRLAASEVVT